MSAFYVAGASLEIARAERCIGALRSMGHTITLDWTVEVRAAQANGKTDRELSRERRIDFVRADLKGVHEADYLWLLIPKKQSIGCWIEFGYAISERQHRDSNCSPIDHLQPTIFASGDFTITGFTEVATTFDYDHQAVGHFMSLV